jgi:hypothetical protein
VRRVLVLLALLVACRDADGSSPEPRCPIPGEIMAVSCTADGCLVCFRNLGEGNQCRFMNPQLCRP